GVGVLDGDQLHVRHGDEVAEVGGVVERVPVAYLDCGDADRHGVLFMDARSLRQYASYCVNLRQPWKGAPEIAGPAASVDRAAVDTKAYKSGTNPGGAAASCRPRACYLRMARQHPASIQNDTGCTCSLPHRSARITGASTETPYLRNSPNKGN